MEEGNVETLQADGRLKAQELPNATKEAVASQSTERTTQNSILLILPNVLTS